MHAVVMAGPSLLVIVGLLSAIEGKSYVVSHPCALHVCMFALY